MRPCVRPPPRGSFKGMREQGAITDCPQHARVVALFGVAGGTCVEAGGDASLCFAS